MRFGTVFLDPVTYDVHIYSFVFDRTQTKKQKNIYLFYMPKLSADTVIVFKYLYSLLF